MKANITKTEDSQMEEPCIIKTASCPSLSERSTLTYEIGCKGDKTVHLRLTENTGSGMFSKVWVPLAQIALLLSANDKPVSSRTIRSLYTGSANSVGFLLAVLKDIGLIKNIEENSRGYARTDPKKFSSDIHALLENKTPPEEKPAKVKKIKNEEPC